MNHGTNASKQETLLGFQFKKNSFFAANKPIPSWRGWLYKERGEECWDGKPKSPDVQRRRKSAAAQAGSQVQKRGCLQLCFSPRKERGKGCCSHPRKQAEVIVSWDLSLDPPLGRTGPLPHPCPPCPLCRQGPRAAHAGARAAWLPPQKPLCARVLSISPISSLRQDAGSGAVDTAPWGSLSLASPAHFHSWLSWQFLDHTALATAL